MQNEEEILYLGYNQDQACFSVGTENGFKIFNSSPFKETYQYDLQGGIGIVEMLQKSNILALVGGGKEPKYQSQKLMLWDEHRGKIIVEMTFNTDVKAVKLKADRIVVVLESKIFVYDFSNNLELIYLIDTIPNPLGLCSMNMEVDNTILACPDNKNIGIVIVYNYGENKQIQVKAHQEVLNCIQLNPKGTKLATASQKGTIIRIFDCKTGEALQELRRGSEYAQIYSVAFDSIGRFIACSSDSGTTHIFCISQSESEKQEMRDEINQEIQEEIKQEQLRRQKIFEEEEEEQKNKKLQQGQQSTNKKDEGGLFGGMNKRFLSGGNSKNEKQNQKQQDNIQGIKIDEKAKKQNKLEIPEVQQAMQANDFFNKNQKQWMTPEFLDNIINISKNDKFKKMFTNPEYMLAIQMMQTNPKEVMEKYGKNPEFMMIIQEFNMGDQLKNVQLVLQDGQQQQQQQQDQKVKAFLEYLQKNKGADITKSQKIQQVYAKNPKSKLSFMKFIVPYFDSEWSFAYFRVMDSKTNVAFSPTEPNTIIVISYEGNYYQCEFDPVNGGECKLKLKIKF